MNDPVPTPSSAWKKTAVTITGGLLVLVGVALLVLPGPGLVVIAAGLAVLASEYVWAKRLLQRVRAKIDEGLQRARGRH
jgi:uncharacterized protein (TIGR02611 family)